MPIYVYQCQNCKKEFELLVLNKNEEIKCGCRSKDLNRMITTFSVGKSTKNNSSGGTCPTGTCNLD